MDETKREEPGMAKLRDSVIEELTGQYALERISMDEFEHRVDEANAARTRAGLESLIADLPALPDKGAAGTTPAEAARSDAELPYRVNRGRVPEHGDEVAIFSGADRRGHWIVPRSLSVLSFFGGAKIDLREAELPPDGLTVDVLCVFGGTDVIIPEGVNVAVEGFGIFGGFSRPQAERQYPGAPLVRVRGVAFFGGTDVRIKRSRIRTGRDQD